MALELLYERFLFFILFIIIFIVNLNERHRVLLFEELYSVFNKG